jgi:twinkle protein
MSNFADIGIQVKGKSEQQKTRCPNCIKLGKENWKDNSLSINLKENIYNCHKCGWNGKIKQDKEMTIQYKRPEVKYMKSLTENGKEFLLKRGITQEVIDNNKIVSTTDGKGIIFPYFKNGELINYKTRGIGNKSFMQSKDAEPLVYNYDACKGKEKIVICEGELDSLSWEVAKVTSHTSVNMGAPNVGDKNIDRKLECLNTCYDIFQNAKVVYIATDEDENGRNLQKELVRRFGADKCLLVDLKPFKDANEVLIAEGTESLLKRLKSASTPKVEGIFTISDVKTSMLDGFHNGQVRGTTTHIPSVDKAWTWRSGEVNIWTGYQNEGKSIFINQLATLKAALDGWRFGVFSPENMPITDFFNDIVEMYIGKSSDPYFRHQMNINEYEEAMDFVQKHFFIIYPKKDFRLPTLFERAEYLVRTKGINSLIIDPYNTVHHRMKAGEREDLYISRFMSELKRFALDHSVSVNLVAHQVTPMKDEQGRYYKPDVNRIKGGGTFADKADNVMFIWRPDRGLDYSSTNVTFGSQKIKKQKLVGTPQEVCNIEFDVKEQRYYFNGVTPFVKVDEKRRGGSI